MIDPTVNKIEAIQAVRAFTRETFGPAGGLGLKEAKDIIDAIAEQIRAEKEKRQRLDACACVASRIQSCLDDVDAATLARIFGTSGGPTTDEIAQWLSGWYLGGAR